MSIKASFARMLFLLLTGFVFGVINYFLLVGLFNDSSHPVLIVLSIAITLLLIVVLYELPKLIYFVFSNKPILELFDDGLHEHYHHKLKIPLDQIKLLEVKNVLNAFGPPVELRITLKSKNDRVGKNFNIPSLRSTPQKIIVFPTALGWSGKKVRKLCKAICELNPAIRYNELDVYDDWERKD